MRRELDGGDVDGTGGDAGGAECGGERGVVPPQLKVELQQPSPAVRALEQGMVLGAQVGRLRREVLRGQVAGEQGGSRWIVPAANHTPIEQQAVLLKTGLQATLWGAQIITSRLVPVGTVYVCCEPEMFGRIPVRTELTVLSADDPKARTIGFSVFENLGIGAYNPKGLDRLIVTR